MWDLVVGIIFRDGNVLLKKDYFNQMIDENYRTIILTDPKLTDPNINHNEGILNENYKTNIFISESKVSELFENVN